MAELADAGGLNPPALRGVWVQVPLRALRIMCAIRDAGGLTKWRGFSPGHCELLWWSGSCERSPQPQSRAVTSAAGSAKRLIPNLLRGISCPTAVDNTETGHCFDSTNSLFGGVPMRPPGRFWGEWGIRSVRQSSDDHHGWTGSKASGLGLFDPNASGRQVGAQVSNPLVIGHGIRDRPSV